MDFLNFKIKNFKGIEDTTINLNSNSNIYTLIGLNESGKTTVLEALNYWSYSQESKETVECLGFQTIQDDYELIPIGETSNFSKQISVSATLKLSENDELDIKKYAEENCNFILTEKIDKITITKSKTFANSQSTGSSNYWTIRLMGKTKGSRSKKVIDLSSKEKEWQCITLYIRDNLLPTILYFPNFLFDFPERIYLEDFDEDSKKQKEHLFYKKIIQDLLDTLNQDLDIQTHIVNRKRSGNDNDENSLKKVLLDLSRELNNNILGAWNEIFKRKISNKRILVEAKLDRTVNKVYLEFMIEDDGYFSINQRSLGFRWFFAFLLFTKYRGYRSRKSNNILFLLDEPASNLHTTAQHRLQKSLAEMAKEDCKFIYTTHSQYLINPKWLETTYIVKNEGLSYETDENIDDFTPKKTKITIHPYRQFVSTYPDQTSYFKPVLDIIDYKPSELDMIPDVVMVEGKNDYYTLKYFEDIILQRENKKYKFLPGLSCKKLFPLIQHYLAWGKNFIILLDGDRAGEDSKKRYLDEFGSILKNKVFSLNDINELANNSKMEDCIIKEDKISLQKISDSNSKSYSKKLFNRTLQELYISEQKFEFSESSTNNIKSILEYLDSKF
ncbi:uncharacterized protein BN819_01013 [Clostridium sp. CAG:967]|nr:uncharacterized protein BN819_01013 [Clostridium sp. CAG:967]